MNGHLLKSGALRSGWARTRSGVVQAQLVTLYVTVDQVPLPRRPPADQH